VKSCRKMTSSASARTLRVFGFYSLTITSPGLA
jgi:hypothetical protein